jgi:hypothetical protein
MLIFFSSCSGRLPACTFAYQALIVAPLRNVPDGG